MLTGGRNGVHRFDTQSVKVSGSIVTFFPSFNNLFFPWSMSFGVVLYQISESKCFFSAVIIWFRHVYVLIAPIFCIFSKRTPALLNDRFMAVSTI